MTLPSFSRMVSASSGLTSEIRRAKASKRRKDIFIILLPWGILLTRFSKTRMLLQAGEGTEEQFVARMHPQSERLWICLITRCVRARSEHTGLTDQYCG